MKKALALVLALVLALSMGVSAFANTVVTLKPVTVDSTASRIDITPTANIDNKPFCVYEQGAYYFRINGIAANNELEDIKLTTNGNVTAALVEYDVHKYSFTGETFYVYDSVESKYLKADDSFGSKGYAEVFNDYDTVCEEVDKLNEDNTTGRYIVVPAQNVYIVKFVVADNYSVHYTSGTIKIEAYDATAKEDVTGTVTIINDVINFEYEMVKYTSDNYDDKAPAKLVVDYTTDANTGDQLGYSDYLGAGDYGTASYKYAENRVANLTAVVATTAFRVIAGEGLVVSSKGIEVDIPAVAAGQKGVNFKAYAATELNEEGYTRDYWYDTLKKDANTWEIASIDFGFLGDQVISSDFTVSYELPYTWFTLREKFEIKVEEDDIITYYLLKDGKLVKEYKVDYMTIGDKLNDAVEIELDLKNTTLGEYSLVLEVPSTEVAGEENPNTGAESVVGVVAALAVVSLASAAAVSLKK